MNLKNDLFLRALNGEPVERPPVWMMRQAGRYLPEFRALREKYSFFERCQNPELAAEITLQPIDRLGPDAAILFSDILVVPQALGMTVEMRRDVGPWLPDPIKTSAEAFAYQVPDVEETLGYVFEAIRLAKEGLAGRVPLIGFAGSPWTLFCYMIQGQGSKSFDKAKAFCFTQPEAAHHVLQVLTDTIIAYLKKKVAVGVDAVQIFDSWGGLLDPSDYQIFSWPYIKQISDALKELVPVVVFAKGCWFALEEMSQCGVALGVDWTVTPEWARRLTGGKVTLQGNMDPSRLLAPIPEIEKNTREMIKRFGKDRYVANLGHGILPNIPVDHARAFIDTVKAYQE